MDNQCFEQLVLLDAFTSPFENMSKGHIKSHFKSINGFIDVRDALKDHPELWRKNGLYTAYTQMIPLLSYCATAKIVNRQQLYELITEATTTIDGWSSIFRYSDKLSMHFISNLGIKNPVSEYRAGCSPLIYTAIYSQLVSRKEPSLIQLAEFVLNFTENGITISAALIFERLLRQVRGGRRDSADRGADKSNALLKQALKVVTTLQRQLSDLLPWLFQKGVHPDSVENGFNLFENILQILLAGDPDEGEELITTFASSQLKDNITRATVDNPLVTLPYVLFIIDQNSDKAALFSDIVRLGGAVQELSLLAALLLAPINDFDDYFPSLRDEIINKNKIFTIIKAAVVGKFDKKKLLEFLTSEKTLTAKVNEQLKALCKHGSKNKKKSKPVKQSRRSQEEQLSRHVVESWTKKDKARYKKEKQRES